MPRPELVIRGERVVTPEACGAASVHIREGRIVAVAAFDDVPRGCQIVEAGRSVVMPGLVDSHVHVNEPGRTHWEGFETATRAAAAGGVTTIVDMPLNCIPPTTTTAALREKLAAAEGKCAVDVAFWGGLVPGNTGELGPLSAAGVVGFKCFLIDSGVAEFPHVAEPDLRGALPELVRLGATLIVHAEVPGPVEMAAAVAAETPGREVDASDTKRDETAADRREAAAGRHETAAGRLGDAAISNPVGDPRRYRTFLDSRPRAAEDEAVALMIALSREYGARVHIVHHSSADALPLLRAARAEGLPVTAETCPHYLSFAAETIPDGATEFKCCPPIRERENNERLWEALREELIGMIVSDHSPCPPELKRREEGNFMSAWGGISSLQLRLPLVWTGAARRGFSFNDLARWLAAEPARLCGLGARKGALAVGRDADVCIWNAEESFRVEAPLIEHRHKLTPYLGQTLRGVVESTYVRGRMVYGGGEVKGPAAGRLVGHGGAEIVRE